MRLFLGLELPAPVREACAKDAEVWQARYPKGNYSQASNYHVTLRFLGECEEALVGRLEAVCQHAAAATPPFSLALGPVDAFFRGSEAIVHWTLEGDTAALTALHERCAQALLPLGFEPEAPPYRPHITLARRVRRVEAAALAGQPVPEAKWQADALSLMHSTRVEDRLAYVPLFRTPLGTQQAVVDRMEGEAVVCQRLPDGAPLRLTPGMVEAGVQEQDVLVYRQGVYEVDRTATEARKQQAQAALARLFQRKKPE